MARTWQYRADQELPHRALAWYERDSNDLPSIIDFTSDWTFTIDIVDDSGVKVKSFTNSDVVKSDIIPNVILKWPASAFTDLDGEYRVHVMARKVSTGLDDMFDPEDPPILQVTPVPTDPV